MELYYLTPCDIICLLSASLVGSIVRGAPAAAGEIKITGSIPRAERIDSIQPTLLESMRHITALLQVQTVWIREPVANDINSSAWYNIASCAKFNISAPAQTEKFVWEKMYK